MEDADIVDLYGNRSENAIAETAGKYGAYLNQIASNVLNSKADPSLILSWIHIPVLILIQNFQKTGTRDGIRAAKFA